MLPRGTVNRLLLHGSRHHRREALFATPNGRSDPDWRCDRLSIRLALALREVFSLGPGDVAALWIPLSMEWALLERALWGLGSVSLAIPVDRGFAKVEREVSDRDVKVLFARAALPDLPLPAIPLAPVENGARGSLAELLDRGGVLDTPERAAAFRAVARELPPSSPASLEAEEGMALTQGEWADRIQDHLRRHPPRPGGRRLLSPSGTGLSSRIELYSGWADGLTTVVFEEEGARG